MAMRTLACMLLALCTVNTAHADLGDEMVAHYRMNGNAEDASSFGNNGTVVNALPTNDRFGNPESAYDFAGTERYINVPDNSSLILPDTVSISAWVKKTIVNTLAIVVEKGGDWYWGETNYGLALHSEHAYSYMLYFFFRGGYRGCVGVYDTDWHHVAAVAVHGQWNPQLYVDGENRGIMASHGGAINLFPSERDLHIGAQVDPLVTVWGTAHCDEVRIYNRALTQDEITLLAGQIALDAPLITQVAAVGADSIRMEWDPVPAATQYKVYSSLDAYAAPGTWILSATGILYPFWEGQATAIREFYYVTAE